MSPDHLAAALGLNARTYPQIDLLHALNPVDLPFDGQWHRWAGRRLAYRFADEGYAVQNVSLLRWVLRWGGRPPQLAGPWP